MPTLALASLFCMECLGNTSLFEQEEVQIYWNNKHDIIHNMSQAQAFSKPLLKIADGDPKPSLPGKAESFQIPYYSPSKGNKDTL